MPEYSTRFDAPDNRTLQLPHELLANGGRYEVKLYDGDIYINGNRDGLLYLAEVVIRCAMGGFVSGFHVHLPLCSDDDGPPSGEEVRDELVIFAASEERL